MKVKQKNEKTLTVHIKFSLRGLKKEYPIDEDLAYYVFDDDFASEVFCLIQRRLHNEYTNRFG